MKYLDLFAGSGGLSLGLRSAGLVPAAAVEKSVMAGETYFKNLVSASDDSFRAHLQKASLEQLNSGLLIGDVGELLRLVSTGTPTALEGLDVLVGGPPCQGFSLAGKRDPKDKRNQLPWLFLEAVDVLSPKFVLIENVAGMTIPSGRDSLSTFESLTRALENTGEGYRVQKLLLNSSHYGAPQYRRRLFIFGVRNDQADIINPLIGPDTWHSNFLDEQEGELPTLAPRPNTSRSQAHTLRDAIFDLAENKSSSSSYVHDTNAQFSGVLVGPSPGFSNHDLRRHSSKTQQRFALIQLLDRKGVRFSDASLSLLKSIDFPVVDSIGNEYTSLTSLSETIHKLRTKKHSQKLLQWDRPSPTVVTIPDDYIHPSQTRVMTVREMARIQGFPDQFTFHSKVTTGGTKRQDEVPQYSQVGNAVSPWVALALGRKLLALDEQLS